MKGYVGQTRSTKLIEKLREFGIGEATQPDEWPPRRMPYFLDNGAFKLWTSGRSFDEQRFARLIERVDAEGPAPEWIVVPDKVAHPDSLSYSLSWLPRLRGIAPLALVVQDGMTIDGVRAAMKKGFDVIFVGGTLEWKFATTKDWVKLGKEIGAKVHVGRIGTGRRAKWARELGVDSVDSCTPLFSENNLARWMNGMKREFQQGLWGPETPPAKAHNIKRKAKA